MTDESSSEELTRDISNLSVSSNASTKVSDSDEEKYAGDEFEEGETGLLSKESTSTSLKSTSSSSSSSSSIVNNQRDETIKINLSDRDSDHEQTVKEGKKGVISRENTNVSTSSEDSSNKKSSRENTNVSIKLTSSSDDEGTDDGNQAKPSRENTNISITSSDDRNQAKPSRENTNVSVTSSDDGNQAKPSRENTNISVTSSDDGNQADSKYEDDFNDDDKSSRESSFMSNSSNNTSKSESTADGSDEELKLDKEDSVLIERDGKFELVDPNELKMEYFNLLGLPEEKPKKKPSSARQSREKVEVPQRNSHSSLSKSAYGHIQSSYAMSGQQKEMKKRRINLIKVRKDEEKEKQKEEEKQRRIAAEKSFKVWLNEKTSYAKEHERLKRASNDKTQDKERLKDAQNAYQAWLVEKQQSMKEEKRMEKLRLEDEAQAYIIRSRDMCDRAFKEWLNKKKYERGANDNRLRKKSAAPTKKKKLASSVSPKKRTTASARYPSEDVYSTSYTDYSTFRF